jgi:hypothetical protein
MLRYTLVLLAGLGGTASAWADSWGDSMFDSVSKDFGAVQRGPMLSHPFRFTNNTGQRLHISNVRVSCGCTSASALQTDIDPGQTGVIQATMDTHRFVGLKTVTIFVTFDQPRWEEARLSVHANGRDDISVGPEAFVMGTAKHGSEPKASVAVTLMGGGDWKIEDIERESNYIQTSLKERNRDGGSVTYDVSAWVRRDAPVGKWYSEVWLKTNNPSAPKIRVPLNVEIESSLSVTPDAVALGDLKAGGQSERKVIVRGLKPFKITKVQGTDDQLTVKDSTSESKPVHELTLTWKPKKGGDLERKLKVLTDLAGDGEVEFVAKAKITQ